MRRLELRVERVSGVGELARKGPSHPDLAFPAAWGGEGAAPATAAAQSYRADPGRATLLLASRLLVLSDLAVSQPARVAFPRCFLPCANARDGRQTVRGGGRTHDSERSCAAMPLTLSEALAGPTTLRLSHCIEESPADPS